MKLLRIFSSGLWYLFLSVSTFSLQSLIASNKTPNSYVCAQALEKSKRATSTPLPEWWYAGEIPVPRLDSPLNPEAFQNWQDAQPERIQFIIEFVKRHLQRISFKEFVRALEGSFQRFLNDRRDASKPLLFIVDIESQDSARSTLWVTGLLRARFPEEMKYAEYAVKDNGYFDPDSVAKIDSGHFQIVVADDAAYTGSFLKNSIQDDLRMSLFFRHHRIAREVDIVCPFMTDVAQSTLKTMAGIQIFSSVVIPTIDNLVAALSDDQRSTQIGSSYLFFSILPRHTVLIFFDHKIPDFVSMPSAVHLGSVFELTSDRKPKSRRSIPLSDAAHWFEVAWGIRATGTIPFFRSNCEPYKFSEKRRGEVN